MFQFAGFPPRGSRRGAHGPLPHAGSPIQTPADRRASAAPRSFSQLVASFVGPQCQGIRPAPFLAWPSWRAPPSVAGARPRLASLSLASLLLRFAILWLSLCLGIRFSRYGRGSTPQWRLRDSNSRPPACKAGALPAELSPLWLPYPYSLFFLFFGPAAACFPMPSPA